MEHLIDTSKFYPYSEALGGYFCIHCGVAKDSKHNKGCPVCLLEKATYSAYMTVYDKNDDITRTEEIAGSTLEKVIAGALHCRKSANDLSTPDKFDSEVRISLPDVEAPEKVQQRFLSGLTDGIVGLLSAEEAKRWAAEKEKRLNLYHLRLQRLNKAKEDYMPEAYDRYIKELKSSFADVLGPEEE